jgi:cell division protein ZipA
MEADSLRWSLLLIGSLVIVGLTIHGIWLSRKNSEKKSNARKHKKKQQYQPSGWQTDTVRFDEKASCESKHTDEDFDIKFDIESDNTAPVTVASDIDQARSTLNEFDDLGVSAVRVFTHAEKVNAHEEQTLAANTQVELDAPANKIYASVVTRPKPEYAAKYASSAAETKANLQQKVSISNQGILSPKVSSAHHSGTTRISVKDNYQAPEPPPFLLKKELQEHENDNDNDSTPSVLAEEFTQDNPSEVAMQKKAEHEYHTTGSEESKRHNLEQQSTGIPEPKEKVKTKPLKSEQPQEVLVLNVKTADDDPILGSALLPMLLTLGFKFGEQDIFHRHVSTDGKGLVLFSLANMFKPGNFDIDNLETFTTQGISLFMILPIAGEPHQVFNMMHNAARKIAEEFSAQIYDGKRTLLTKQSLQQYVEKIREFERQRLLRD